MIKLIAGILILFIFYNKINIFFIIKNIPDILILHF